MDIERIRMKTHLKSGAKVWGKGCILDRKDGPFPSEINEELRAQANLPESLQKIELLGPVAASVQKTDDSEARDAMVAERRELTELREDVEIENRKLIEIKEGIQQRESRLDDAIQKFEEEKVTLHEDREAFEDEKAKFKNNYYDEMVDNLDTDTTKVVSLNEKINVIVKGNNGNWNAATKAIGISLTSLKNWYGGKSTPSVENLAKIDKAYRVFKRLNDDPE